MIDENLLAKCSFYCGACPTFISGDCIGCNESQTESDCFTRDCVIGSGLNFCGECENFPYETIMTKSHVTVLDRDWLAWKKTTKKNSKE